MLEGVRHFWVEALAGLFEERGYASRCAASYLFDLLG
jgi:hypothetical protein